MSDHSDLLKRFADLQKETISGCEAFTRQAAAAADFPYWTNALGPGEFELDGDEQAIEVRRVLSRLIIGHVTQDYNGEVEDDLYEQVSIWHQAIADAPQLIGTTNTTAPTYLHALGVWLESDTGLEFFLTPGVGAVQIGIEFTHICHLFEAINT